MKRPVTPENKTDIYKDGTICKTTKPILVRIEDTEFSESLFGIDVKHPQELPVGSEVIVFDAQTVNLTGVNEPMDPANTAYRIESKLKLTVYEGISDDLTEDNCSNEKLRKHCNLVPVVPLDCDLHEPLPLGTIVAIKESTSYNRVVLPQGELFVITSKPKTPRGQAFRPRYPIAGAMYDVKHVKKGVSEFKVRNPSNLVVMHKNLESIPRESL